jgi:hypothetical protein
LRADAAATTTWQQKNYAAVACSDDDNDGLDIILAMSYVYDVVTPQYLLRAFALVYFLCLFYPQAPKLPAGIPMYSIKKVNRPK